MHLKKSARFILFFSLFIILAATAAAPPPRPAGNAYDLIAVVNEWRAAVGLPALEIDGSLMAAAYAHSEYQASIGYWTHQGADGSDETVRARAAGYGGGQSIVCDEAVAFVMADTPVSTVVYSIWDDYDHRELVLLNARYVHVGAGAVEKDGRVFYTLDVCATGSGRTNYTPNPVTSAPRTPASTAAVVVPVQTATPQEDGSIIHVVQPGQAPWSIAIAYGVKIADIARLNGLSVDNPVVYIGDKLLIQAGVIATATQAATETPPPATRTPRPTVTLRPTNITPSGKPPVTQTQVNRQSAALPALPSGSRRSVGIGIIVVCGVGLLLILLSGLRKS